MNGRNKTKEQSINELEKMRQRLAELETSEGKLKALQEDLYTTKEERDAILNSMTELVAL